MCASPRASLRASGDDRPARFRKEQGRYSYATAASFACVGSARLASAVPGGNVGAVSERDSYIGGLDWTLFHALNGLTRGRDGFQDAAEIYNASAIFAVVAVAGAIWFLARPGGSLRSKLAAVSAALSAALALLANATLGSFWFHPRPFIDHPRATVLLVGHGGDNSFPSDHASVAFAVAFAVLMFHRRLGLLLLVAAIGVGLDRILVGVHYPVDVGASVLVGLGSALVVTRLGEAPTHWLARQLSRLSDPLVLAVNRRITRR